MADKKEKPISVRLSSKAMARLNRLSTELDMNRTSVIQEALKALEREQEARKAAPGEQETAALQNGHHADGTAVKREQRAEAGAQ